MQIYKNFSPTAFDAKGLNCEREGICNFGIVVARNRDSEPLEESNFTIALEMLGGESENVQVHRFRHWGNGWFELILVKPNTKEWTIALEIEERLSDYPVLDEMHYCQLEYDTYTEAGYIQDENGEWIYATER